MGRNDGSKMPFSNWNVSMAASGLEQFIRVSFKLFSMIFDLHSETLV